MSPSRRSYAKAAPIAGAGDFFRYLPCPPAAETWGLVVTGAGVLRNAPGGAYPPAGHPADHALSWEYGRVLPAWQIVFIAEGGGRFESRRQALREVGAGTALVLFPHEWHRYAPDRGTGWTEWWVELQGPGCARLEAAGEWSAEEPCVVPERAAMESVLRRICGRLRESSATGAGELPVPELSAAAWEVAALIASAGSRRRRGGGGGGGNGRDAEAATLKIEQAVRRAEMFLLEQVDAPPSMPELAERLGVAYSYFRREFRRRTGLSPGAYVRRLRLEKARRLLGNSRATLAEVAEALGFSSAYHLSSAFKQAFGVSPATWRQGRGAS